MAKKKKRKNKKKGAAPGSASPSQPRRKVAPAAPAASGSSPFIAPATLQRVGRISSILVGLVFLLAGTMKVADAWNFLGSLPAYGVPTAARLPVTVLMPTIEVVLGIMLVAGWRLRQASIATACFLVLFGGVIAYGWRAGTLQECGCFGSLMQRTPPEALAWDSAYLALAVVGFLWAPAGKLDLTRRQWGILGTVALASMVFIGSTLALDRSTLEERLAAAEFEVRDNVTGLGDLDTRNNDYFLYLFHPDCPHCVENAPRVARIIRDESLPELIGITHSVGANAIDIYQRRVGEDFRAVALSTPGFVQITGDGAVPQLVYYKRGQVERVWKGDSPSTDDLRAYMSLQ